MQVSILRPHNIIIEGRLRLCAFSNINIDKKSRLVVRGNLKLKKSKLHLKDSTAELADHSSLQGTSIVLTSSQWNSGSHLRAFDFNIKLNRSSLNAGPHLMLWRAPFEDGWILAEQSELNVGENVRIESKLHCDHSSFTTGSNVFLNNGTELRCHQKISIGSDVLVSYGCIIFDTNTHSLDVESRRREIHNGFPNNTIQSAAEQAEKKPISIGNGAWVGMRAVILKGSIIGNNAIVGTCCVVGGNVPDGQIAVGNPFTLKSPKNNK